MEFSTARSRTMRPQLSHASCLICGGKDDGDGIVSVCGNQRLKLEIKKS